jgi:hypothetical protein
MFSKRGMNNSERQTAADLKKLGFTTIWQQEGANKGSFYAQHPKLTCIYHLNTCASLAIEHLSEKNKLSEPCQQSLF